jgi:hypothetical protein
MYNPLYHLNPSYPRHARERSAEHHLLLWRGYAQARLQTLHFFPQSAAEFGAYSGGGDRGGGAEVPAAAPRAGRGQGVRETFSAVGHLPVPGTYAQKQMKGDIQV